MGLMAIALMFLAMWLVTEVILYAHYTAGCLVPLMVFMLFGGLWWFVFGWIWGVL